MEKEILNSIKEAVIVSNSEGNIIYCNSKSEKLFGYKMNELIGKNIESLVPIEMQKNHVHLRNDYIKNPVNRPHGLGLDVHGLKKDGTILPVEVSLSFFYDKNKLFVVSLISDIAKRKNKEEEIRRFIKERKILETKYLKTQLQVLKNQIDPHYLFNCLNILNNMIRSNDHETASQFGSKIAKTYGYVLETRKKTLVNLKEELDFLQNYFFVQQRRFPNSIDLKIDSLLFSFENIFVVPLALQLLVENAFKHNIISKENPLLIEVVSNNEYLIVRNNRIPKPKNDNRKGLGLENLNKQYQLLSKKGLKIISIKKRFEVLIPIIKNDLK